MKPFRADAPAAARFVMGGVAADHMLPALRTLEPDARACWAYDLDVFEQRARRFLELFAPLRPLAAFALKANALPVLLERARGAGLGADAGSLGELEIAKRAGFAPEQRVLNGNGRTPEEADWVAREGVALVNADSLGELDLLERAAGKASRSIRVALRVNPGIETPGHRYVATGGEDAKFGIAPVEALEAWAGRARWPHLALEGVHVHVGSQIVDVPSLERALEISLELATESAKRGAPLRVVNLGGGFGIDYQGGERGFPLDAWAAKLIARVRGLEFEWLLEPGRWIAAPCGVLLAEVLAVKRRGARRFVVLAAGMNDLIRPALYHASHRIVPIAPREGPHAPAAVVGPVCESSDVFAAEIELPPIETGDVLAILDAGAYGAAMASNYNGRGRLAEVVASEGSLTRARAGETTEDLAARRSNDSLLK
ncbi:MAG TPA: diaminopimelate decarboxylase [Candidatus Udaeobacter sp.]|jgi:diaminopimelate decarboxylase|nr:diaminopimelate decarboxylase [Candidatus Udaeobacter sp.]